MYCCSFVRGRSIEERDREKEIEGERKASEKRSKLNTNHDATVSHGFGREFEGRIASGREAERKF